jgi:hypothetical protein
VLGGEAVIAAARIYRGIQAGGCSRRQVAGTLLERAAMRLLSLNALLLACLALSSAACTQNDALFITDATATRLADGRVTTTVTVTCDGDCTAHASNCARVTWEDLTLAPVDDTTACATTAPAGGGSETLVVTSKVALPEGASISGVVQLGDADGHPFPNTASNEGAAENTEQTISDP